MSDTDDGLWVDDTLLEPVDHAAATGVERPDPIMRLGRFLLTYSVPLALTGASAVAMIAINPSTAIPAIAGAALLLALVRTVRTDTTPKGARKPPTDSTPPGLRTVRRALRSLDRSAEAEVRFSGAIAARLPVPLNGADVFDPSRAADRRIADEIRRLRRTHGLGLEGRRLVGTVHGMAYPALEKRLEVWGSLARGLGRFGDLRAAWLAALACTETRRLDRVVDALRLMQDHPETLERLRAWLETEGPICGRVGAALAHEALDDVDDGLVAVGGHVDASERPLLTEAFERRWARGPAPARLAAWSEIPQSALALAAADLPADADGRWGLLVAHADLEVVMVALPGALARSASVAIAAARVVLSRPDVRAAIDDRALSSAARSAVGDALDVLALQGEFADLATLGAWWDAPQVGERARRSHAALKTVLGAEDRIGKLSVVADEARIGGLSEPEPGA